MVEISTTVRDKRRAGVSNVMIYISFKAEEKTHMLRHGVCFGDRRRGDNVVGDMVF